MPAITATAPGKAILCGEHAVVYGYPAIAVPVAQVQARAVVKANPRGLPGQVRIKAPQVSLDALLDDLDANQPLARAVRCVLDEIGIRSAPACSIRVTSTIPMASGLGSGAAVSVALIRAFAGFLGHPLSPERISALAFEVEVLYHGNPSGIDNTVITHNKPVYYLRGQPITTLEIPMPFTLVIADTGVSCPTSVTVGDVRRAWQADQPRLERLFDAIGKIVSAARNAIEKGKTETLGPLMDENQRLLQALDVSSPDLERLILAARAAGAQGAKLSGGGRGGNIIALATPHTAPDVRDALLAAGATTGIITQVA